MASPKQVQIAFLERANLKILEETRGLLIRDQSKGNYKKVYSTSGGYCVAIPFYKASDVTYQHPQKMVRVWFRIVPLQPSLEYRSKVVDSYLTSKNLPYFVKSQYYNEVLSVKDEVLPGAIMDFIEGEDLIDYLSRCVKLPSCYTLLDQLAMRFRRMCEDLKMSNISHGDLSGNNIRILPNGEIRLMDYDSICIPELVGKGYSTDGTGGYNHVQRAGSKMQLNADYFPEIVIYLTILLLRESPYLWEKYLQSDTLNDGGMLFTSRMLEDISVLRSSTLYNDIQVVAKKNPEISQVFNILLQSIQCDFNDVPFLFSKTPSVNRSKKAFYCGSCGHHFDNQTDIYCPMCGAKRETI